MQVGQSIRHLRNQKGLSLRELARRAGVDHSNLGKIERGTGSSPTLDTLEKIAKALNVTLSEMLAPKTSEQEAA